MTAQSGMTHTAEQKLDDYVRQEAKRVQMKPADENTRPNIEAHFIQAAKVTGVRLYEFIDQVHERLIDDLPSDNEHLIWFRKNFLKRSRTYES